MKTQCLIDVENKTIELVVAHESNRLVIDFIAVQGKEEKCNFKDVNFGYQIQKNGKEIIENSWPAKGTAFSKFAPGLITSEELMITPESEYKLLVWYTKKDYRTTDVKMFNSLRPEKAYESMVWNETEKRWEMLKPMPEDGKDYFWEEENLSWKIVEEE